MDSSFYFRLDCSEACNVPVALSEDFDCKLDEALASFCAMIPGMHWAGGGGSNLYRSSTRGGGGGASKRLWKTGK